MFRKLIGPREAGKRMQPISVRLPEDLYVFLKEQCEEAHISLSLGIVQVLRMWQDDLESKAREQGPSPKISSSHESTEKKKNPIK